MRCNALRHVGRVARSDVSRRQAFAILRLHDQTPTGLLSRSTIQVPIIRAIFLPKLLLLEMVRVTMGSCSLRCGLVRDT